MLFASSLDIWDCLARSSRAQAIYRAHSLNSMLYLSRTAFFISLGRNCLASIWDTNSTRSSFCSAVHFTNSFFWSGRMTGGLRCFFILELQCGWQVGFVKIYLTWVDL